MKKNRDDVKTFARIPMAVILITFLVSIFSLLIVNVYFSINSINSFGFAIILIMLILITFSTSSIFRFFMMSVPQKKKFPIQ